MFNVSSLSWLILIICSINGSEPFYIKAHEVLWDLSQFIFTTKNGNEAFFPEIGNGHIATQIKNKYIFMNGIYNGFGVNSHRASIPSSLIWNVSTNDLPLMSLYSLDSVIGVFNEILVFKAYNITISSYANRVDRQILVRNVSLSTSNYMQDVVLRVGGTDIDINSPDFDFTSQELSNAYFIKGETKAPENNRTRKVAIFICMEKIPRILTLSKRNPWSAFITSMDSIEEGANNAFKKALTNKFRLLSRHAQGWIDTWDSGSIIIASNNDFLVKSIHAAQYYILSSLPNINWSFTDLSWSFYGLSPTGLAHGNDLDDYMGHVFWDMDTWMYPAVLPFYHSLSIELIKYRKMMFNAALEISRLNGYKGAQYPWESARTGFETTFDPIVGKNEIHISSDISFAVQQLMWISSKHQHNLYFQLGKDIVLNIARFWRSRLTYNRVKRKYEIIDVMPPDEYVESCNNSAFTNVGAIKSLQAPFLLAKRYQDNITQEMLNWYEVSLKIASPYDKTLEFMFEYDGYKIGSTVKQADVVLLQYPLAANLSRRCFINNLNYYEKVTDVNGPAMTWSIFSINWFDLNDSVKAESFFKKNFAYITSPFYVWTENINGKGAKNFMTGIGGYLQNILYGYMGMRLKFVDNGQLIFNPTSTNTFNNITLHNITFQESNIDVKFNQKKLFIRLLNDNPISVFAVKDNLKYLLNSINRQINLSIQMIVLTSAT